jgi:RNA polymerase sigma factor (TIGR02999 family)
MEVNASSRVPAPTEITRLLAEWSAGNQAALDELTPLVYPELRRLASRCMRNERPDHTLQTTALVHEAYMRLAGRDHLKWETRSHFFALAAQVMRHILVDHARGVRRAKRGSGVAPISLNDVAVVSKDRAKEVLAVNAALDALSALDPRKSRVFELRYFGGMSVDEAAEVLQVSPATVARDWRMAKAWLRREIAPELQNGS